MSPYSYWVFVGLSLTFCGTTTMSMDMSVKMALDKIKREIKNGQCSEITTAVGTILEAVRDRKDCEISSLECPTFSPQPTTCLQSTIMKSSCTTASGKESSQGNRSSTIFLGLLTGILFATLVVVMVGWIVTCIVLKVKLTEKDQQKRTHTEPHQAVPQPTSSLYDGLNHGPSHTTPLAMNYSSLGPHYEIIDEEKLAKRSEHTNRKATAHDSNTVEQETDHTYSMLERKCGQTEGSAGAINISENKDRGKIIAAAATSYEIPLTSKNEKL